MAATYDIIHIINAYYETDMTALITDENEKICLEIDTTPNVRGYIGVTIYPLENGIQHEAESFNLVRVVFSKDDDLKENILGFISSSSPIFTRFVGDHLINLRWVLCNDEINNEVKAYLINNINGGK